MLAPLACYSLVMLRLIRVRVLPTPGGRELVVLRCESCDVTLARESMARRSRVIRLTLASWCPCPLPWPLPTVWPLPFEVGFIRMKLGMWAWAAW